MRSSRIFAKHARCASGILKTRSRPDNYSSTGRAAEKYTRSRCALVEFSPSTPAGLQVFSSRAVGPTTFLRLAAELLKTHTVPTTSAARSVSLFACVFVLCYVFIVFDCFFGLRLYFIRLGLYFRGLGVYFIGLGLYFIDHACIL